MIRDMHSMCCLIAYTYVMYYGIASASELVTELLSNQIKQVLVQNADPSTAPFPVFPSKAIIYNPVLLFQW